MSVQEYRDSVKITRLDPLGSDNIKAPTIEFESGQIELKKDNILRYQDSSGDYQVWKNGAWVSITDTIDTTLYQAAVTSLVSGGNVSRKNQREVTVSAGKGKIVDSWTDTQNVGVQNLQWADTDHQIASIGTEFGAVAIAVDSTSAIVDLPFPLTESQWRDYVVLAFVYYYQVDIHDVTPVPHVANQQQLAFYDYIEYIGLPTRRTGITVEEVTRQRQVYVTSGKVFQPGINWFVNKKSPNTYSFPDYGDASTPIALDVLLQDGTLSAQTQDIPFSWDDGSGTPVLLTGTQATIHYVYAIFGGQHVIQLGQKTYTDGVAARQALSADAADTTPFPGASAAILLAQIWVQNNAADFTDPDRAGINNSVTTVGGGVAVSTQTFLQLGDTPATYAGEAGKFLRVKSDESALEFSSVGASAESIQKEYTQAAHGFTVGTWVYEKTDGTWDRAQSDNLATLKIGMVIDAPTLSTFIVMTYGVFTYAAPHGLNVGATYYLSPSIAGSVELTAPITPGTYQQACVEVLSPSQVKVIDQAVVDNTPARSASPIGVTIPAYQTGYDYQPGDMFEFRGSYYKVLSAINSAPVVPPYSSIIDMGVGKSSSYRLSVTSGADIWVRLCVIQPHTVGSLFIGGDGSGMVMDFSFTDNQFSATTNFSNESNVQFNHVVVLQPAVGNPASVWVKLYTLAVDWLVDFRFHGASASDRPISFSQPLDKQTGDPAGVTLLEYRDLPQNDTGNFPKGSTGSAVDPTPLGTVIQSLLTEAQFNTNVPNAATAWVLCDGRDISTSQFAAWTGVNNVPDLRGGYLRMAGQNASNAAWDGGTLKGYQEDKTAMPDTAFTASSNTTGNHYHSKGGYDSDPYDDIVQKYHSYTAGNPSPLMTNKNKWEDPYSGGNHAEGPEPELATSTDGDHSHTITVSGGDTETRPKTYSVNFFMKIN
jgi:hypothetical protein